MMLAKTDAGEHPTTSAWRGRRLAAAAVLAGLLLAASAAAEEPAPGRLAGMVRGLEAVPIASAHVYAYSVADFKLHKVLTDLAGRFQFIGLPAGLYHIIAYKPGFVPAVVDLIRPAAEPHQTLEVNLLPDERSDPRAGEDYWEARSRIPPDVLREIETQRSVDVAWAETELAAGLDRFSTGVEASTGVDDIVAPGEAQMTSGSVSFEGKLDRVDIGLEGRIRRLEQTSLGAGEPAFDGSVNQVSFDLKSESDARFSLTTASNQLVTREHGIERPVEFDRVRLDYSQPWSESSQSAFSAQVIDEANFYGGGEVEPVGIPRASRTWEVEGSYSRELSDRSMVATGLRYQERQAELALGPAFSPALPGAGERVDIFGEGGYRVRPAMLIEYGVYTVLRDGNLALAPQGGLVLQLNPHWQLAGRASGRFSEQPSFESLGSDFLPSLHSTTERACDQGDERCYQIQLTRKEGDETLSIGAVHRELGETLRLYFSDDFFDRQESVYLVPGDRLPELQVAITHRISPNILTRLESTYAEGGGGTFYAANRDAYENEVRYLITSVDAQFGSTSTGVFLAFHQLEQNLLPQIAGAPPLETLLSERLQLKVSQDLNVLLDLPADWALQLNMELFRGTLADDEDKDALRRRILGGIAVKF